MKIKDIYTISAKLLQTCVESFSQDFGLVLARLIGIDLGRDGQASVLPLCFTGEGFLLPRHIGASRVDFIVPRGLKVIQEGVVLWKRGDSSARIFVWAKGHKTQDDSWLRPICYERHFGTIEINSSVKMEACSSFLCIEVERWGISCYVSSYIISAIADDDIQTPLPQPDLLRDAKNHRVSRRIGSPTEAEQTLSRSPRKPNFCNLTIFTASLQHCIGSL